MLASRAVPVSGRLIPTSGLGPVAGPFIGPVARRRFDRDRLRYFMA